MEVCPLGHEDVGLDSGVVRQDIRSSFGSSSTVAAGVPLTIRFAVLDLANGCAPYAGAAVYVWHCDQEGRYSMYSQGAENENYLRGVQAAGDDGIVEFQSVFPACYQGRWPHVHFEVYPSLDKATSQGNKIATSQIALTPEICNLVYATQGYESSVRTSGPCLPSGRRSASTCSGGSCDDAPSSRRMFSTTPLAHFAASASDAPPSGRHTNSTSASEP